MRTSKPASSSLSALATMGSSRVAQHTRVEVDRLSLKAESVLLVGPEGSGRESLARGIHAASSRSGRPFIVVNCSHFSAGACFDSQLFGHLPGAFVGLNASSLGLIQAAHGGTLFLREVEALELKTQSKLFRALQNQKVVPVGGSEAIPVDVRVIASTSSDLSLRVEDGAFQGDFFQLLSENVVELSRLADRMEDLPVLAAEIVRELSTRRNLPVRRFSPSAADWIGRYEWPGNLRELRQALDAAITADREEIDARSLRLALKKVNVQCTATVVRRSPPVRFAGFAALRSACTSRCRA